MPVFRFCRRAVPAGGLAVVLLAAVLTGCSTRAPAAAGYPDWPRGIDVSSHQHPGGQAINWSSVRASGITFAFVKMDEGPHGGYGRYVNPFFRQDWDGARNAGVLVGAYHYARPRLPVTASADADARAFVAGVGPSIRTSGLPPVLDLEEPDGLGAIGIVVWARQWLATVEALTGRTPVMYSALWYWNSYVAGSPDLARHPLWLARYAESPGLLPGGWRSWSFWQFTAKGYVAGVPAPVDINLSCGRPTELVNECRGTNYGDWAAATYRGARP
jgi:lysozyme